MSDFDFDKLEQLARAATQGPWTSEDGYFDSTPREDGTVGYDDMANVYGAPTEVGTSDRPVQEVPRLAYLPSNADAAFIAAANPATVLELVQRVRAAEGMLCEANVRLRGLSPHADDGPGTLRARIDEALAGREAAPTYDTLRAIVRDLAAADPLGITHHGIDCVLCGEDLFEHGEPRPHAESCPYRRAGRAL